MKLFHGSDVVVENPQILTELRALDFGPGFYLTSNRAQAERWSKIVVRRRRSKNSVLNVYAYLFENSQELNILKFSQADGEWLDFVVSNRKDDYFKHDYDIVIGPVANDSTLPVIDNYMDGVYSKEEAIKRLLPQNLTDQYAFLTDKSLNYLIFKGSQIL